MSANQRPRALLPILLLILPAIQAWTEITFPLADMGEITGITTQTKIYGNAPHDNRTYYKFRNLFYADSVVGEKRFSQPVLRTDPYSNQGENPYDATRTGPLCSQAGLDKDLIDALKTQTAGELLRSSLPPGLIPDILMPIFIPALLDAVEIILELPKGMLDQNRYLHDILHDWLDIDIDTNEECLHLSVSTPWQPDGTEKKDLPVMFFVHGGAFTGGMQIRMGAERLGAWGEVVVVSINYRLALLGFMCLDSDQAAGNMGMLDMVVALEWVHKYIGYFGGDSSRITVFGESAGSAAIGHLLLSDSTNGLFSQGIGQSGSALSSWAFEKKSEYHSRRIAAKVGCVDENLDDLVACLKLAPVTAITNASSEYVTEDRDMGGLGFGGLIPCAQTKGDLKFYTEHQTPVDILVSGEYESVPIFFGANKHEGSYVYAVVHNSFLTYNNLTDDSDFLKYDFLTQLLRTIQMDNSYGIEKILDNAYFDSWQFGNLDAMRPGLIDMLGTFFLKASSYRMVEENSQHSPSFWYSMNYVSEHKSAFHAFFMNPEKKAGIEVPGVCHGDELLYLFDAELPLVFCHSGKISADAVACMADTGNAIADLNNAIACLTSEDGAFRQQWGDCLTGRLSPKEMEISGYMAQMWTNFAIEGHPGFGMEPWSKQDPQYISIDDPITIQVDYRDSYNIGKEEARTSTPAPTGGPTCGPSDTTTTEHVDPGHYCPDEWDLYSATYNGAEHHICFWFGNLDEQVSHDDAALVCDGLNSKLAEVPLGPNLNHWIVDQLLKKTDTLNSEGKPRRPVWDTQYWLGARHAGDGEWRWDSDNSAVQWFDWGDGEPNNLDGQNCLTYMLYEDFFFFRDFKWNDWDCNTAADFICERIID